MRKDYVYVGTWGLNGVGGIGLYDYDAASGETVLVKTIRDDIVAGATLLDESHGILYVTDEQKDSADPGSASGGRVFAFKIDVRTGDLTEINHQDSLGQLPDSICWDSAKEGIMICNHSSMDSVCQVRYDEFGKIRKKRIFHDSTVVHYPILDDGSLGEADAFCVIAGGGGYYACLHSISLAPDGHTFILCDRNQNMVYQLEYQKEFHKIRIKDVLVLEQGADMRGGDCPRYSAFHPKMPIVYINSEFHRKIFTVNYEEDLKLVAVCDATPKKANGRAFSQSDICVSADGCYLYNLYRGIHMVCVHRINERTGVLTMIQEVELEGEGPRGCRLSPDGRFLLVANLNSDDLTTLAVLEDGTLVPVSRTIGQLQPGNVQFYQAQV